MVNIDERKWKGKGRLIKRYRMGSWGMKTRA